MTAERGSQRFARVPVGADADRWSTFAGAKKVLVVVHSVTALGRLLDVLAVLEDELRAQVVYTRIPASAFTDGVEEFLRDVGALVIPWEQAVRESFDLALSASSSGDLHLVKAPLIVMPHGIGYNKYLKTENGKRKTVYGLGEEQLVRGGRVVPAVLVLSHGEQLVRLKESCPEAVPHAVVAGDVCFDRMAASGEWRRVYRERLRVRDGQRLVVVSSTWGSTSLLGADPSVVGRLLRELPVDEYRVAAVVHPNVWHGHGAWQVRSWLADCRRAGLLLIPPREGWRAALAAADCVVGDHGSVTLYGAALGRPTVLAAYDEDDISPGTAMDVLADVAPRLRDGVPLRPQIEDAMRRHDPALGELFAGLAVERRGEAAAVLREAMYRLMGLPEPERPARVVPVPPAEVERAEWGVDGPGVLVASCDADGRVERVPLMGEVPRLGESAHVVVEDACTDMRARGFAGVLVRRAGSPGPMAGVAPERVFALLPSCSVVADVEDDGCVVWLRDGASLKLRADVPDLGVLGSLAYRRPMPKRLRLGERVIDVDVS
ncbi:hypothetical protein AB0L06_26860 [Spirillospora sp. NPDC052269]